MKRIIFILLLLCSGLTNVKAQTYELTIDSIVGIPDTVTDGSEVTFYMIVSTNASLFFQGNIYVELEYAGAFFTADTSIAANAALGPGLPATIQATHRFTSDDGLNIGDNVVVVWPRIGNGVSPPQTVHNPYSTNLTLIEPSGVGSGHEKPVRSSFIFPNPASGTVPVALNLNNVRTIGLTVRDLSGKVILAERNCQFLDLAPIPDGIYIVEILAENGARYYDRVVVAH